MEINNEHHTKQKNRRTPLLRGNRNRHDNTELKTWRRIRGIGVDRKGGVSLSGPEIGLLSAPIYCFHANHSAFFRFLPKKVRDKKLFQSRERGMFLLLQPGILRPCLYLNNANSNAKKGRTQVFQKYRLLQLATPIYSSLSWHLWNTEKAAPLTSVENNIYRWNIPCRKCYYTIPEAQACLNTLSYYK